MTKDLLSYVTGDLDNDLILFAKIPDIYQNFLNMRKLRYDKRIQLVLGDNQLPRQSLDELTLNLAHYQSQLEINPEDSLYITKVDQLTDKIARNQYCEENDLEYQKLLKFRNFKSQWPDQEELDIREIESEIAFYELVSRRFI